MSSLTFSKPSVRRLTKTAKRADSTSSLRRRFIQRWFRHWACKNVPAEFYDTATAEIAWLLSEQRRVEREMQKPDTATKPSDWRSVDQTVEVKSLFFKALGTPVPTDSELVFAAKPLPGAFSNAESFRNAYWAAESWSKFPFELEGVDRKRSAEEAFDSFERQCAAANERLYDAFNKASIPENIRRMLSRARRELEHLFAGVTLDDWMRRCTFSGGASYGLSRVNSAVQNKFHAAFAGRNGATATPGVLPLVDCFQRYSGWIHPVLLVPGNLIEWVPKNAKTDRTIAIEPDWNMFLQQGLGREIRRRLQKRWGMLYPDAQGRQQAKACAGSRDGYYATLDLRGASDCVSSALCEVLLPHAVLQWVNMLRSPVGVKPSGETVSYEKVSSMGNGFTFELETALFAALCRAVSHDVHVYGDDIILPAENALVAIELLTFCGLTINTDKSFIVGPFRESCGGHYFEGVSVTPPYFKKALVGQSRISAANSVRHCAAQGSLESDAGFRATWECLTRGVPKKFFGPSSMGGAVFHVTSDELTGRTFFNRGLQQRFWKGTGIRMAAPSCDAPGLGATYAWLYEQRQKSHSTYCTRLCWLPYSSPLAVKAAVGEYLQEETDTSYEEYSKDGLVPVLFDWKQPTWSLNETRPWSA